MRPMRFEWDKAEHRRMFYLLIFFITNTAYAVGVTLVIPIYMLLDKFWKTFIGGGKFVERAWIYESIAYLWLGAIGVIGGFFLYRYLGKANLPAKYAIHGAGIACTVALGVGAWAGAHGKGLSGGVWYAVPIAAAAAIGLWRGYEAGKRR